MTMFNDDKGWLALTFLMYGLSCGIIGMAAIYSLVLRHYNKQQVFLLYFFMQISIFVMLINTTGIFYASTLWFGRDARYYDSVIVSSTILAFLFGRSFLNTKKHLPKIHLILNICVALLLVELAFTVAFKRVITEYIPFFVFLLFLLFSAFVRYRQGFRPTLFFLLGWSALIASVALSELKLINLGFNPMFIGFPVEAVLVAFALTYYIKEIQDEKEAQKAVMIHQSRLAAMGELLGNIAHQWRQPITNLSYIFMNIKVTSPADHYVQSKTNEGMRQLEFMSDTIENFSSFYKPDTQKEFFSLKEQTLFALDIVRSELNSHNIKAEFAVIQDSDVLGYKNQYVQVVLNLLVNARDALLDMDKDDKKINIRIDKNLVKVQDNGGGIKEDIMAKIFDPHFSTKPKNSGIGLYMSKVIIENNMNGSLDVKNYEFGVIFTIAL